VQCMKFHMCPLLSCRPRVNWESICQLSVSFFCLQVQHKLTEKGVYPALAESIADCLSVRREELHEKMVQDSCAISHAHLVDFDWQVKVQ